MAAPVIATTEMPLHPKRLEEKGKKRNGGDNEVSGAVHIATVFSLLSF
jgi:hypothetical protein